MDYITYKRYKGSGIGGYFNIRHGTKVTENGGFLHARTARYLRRDQRGRLGTFQTRHAGGRIPAKAA